MRLGQFNDCFIPVVDGVARVVNAYERTFRERP